MSSLDMASHHEIHLRRVFFDVSTVLLFLAWVYSGCAKPQNEDHLQMRVRLYTHCYEVSKLRVREYYIVASSTTDYPMCNISMFAAAEF